MKSRNTSQTGYLNLDGLVEVNRTKKVYFTQMGWIDVANLRVREYMEVNEPQVIK